jgi:HlyD family secretion protein
MDGMVLDRKTDKGRTVAASLNAPVLFTLVNDLTKMQINAAVAEADIGTISEKQDVKFTVDAFPNRTFTGAVRQVRNAASTNQSVVSYATIIDVNNDDLKLKPGMTANVSIIVAQKNGVLSVQNSALRVRLPQEIQAKLATPAAAPTKGGDAAKGGAPAASSGMTEEETRRAIFEIMSAVGFQRGSPASPEMIEKAKALAVQKKLDPDLVAARFAMPGGRGKGKGGSGGGGGGGGGGGSSGGFSTTPIERTLYKIVGDVEAKEKKLEAVKVRLGISNGFTTEVLEGLTEGDVLVTSVIMPGAPAPVLQAPGGSSSPFGGSRGGMPGMGSSSGSTRRGG